MTTQKWVLRTKSLDDEEEERTFDSKEAAIDFAVVWYVSAYNPETNETMQGHVPIGMAEDTIRLIKALKADDEFYSGNFYETISLRQSSDSRNG